MSLQRAKTLVYFRNFTFTTTYIDNIYIFMQIKTNLLYHHRRDYEKLKVYFFIFPLHVFDIQNI